MTQLPPSGQPNPSQTTPPALPPPATPQAGATVNEFDVRRIVIIASAVLIGFSVLLFILALVLTLATQGEFASTVTVIRDLVIIFLSLEGILIIISLAVLILQVARLVNLLQTEVLPILENTQETVKTAQTTVEFMSENITSPVIKASAFVTGTSVLLSNMFGIRRVLRRSAEERRDNEA
jgi:hypothetical protein